LFSGLVLPGPAEAVFLGEFPERAGIQEGFSFQLREDFLSLDVQAVPLKQVLRAISEKGGIEIILSDPAEEEIFVKFTELPPR